MATGAHAKATPYLAKVITASLDSKGLTHSSATYVARTSNTQPTMHAGHGAQNPLLHSSAHTGSSYSIQSQTSDRSSATTQGTSMSVLFPPPQPTPPPQPQYNGNEVTANDNVMNSVADASSSLFQVCILLRQRLKVVRDFEQIFVEVEAAADEDTDPVTLLWRTFRLGQPVISLYDILRPGQPLQLPSSGTKEDKKAKAATFKFLQACMTDFKIQQGELFIITDVYGDDTTGFSKVVRVMHRILDEFVRRGLIEDVRPSAADLEQAAKGMKRTQRQHIISELVTTERTYVQHLELLQAFKKMVEQRGIIAGDACHDIFLNLDMLLDSQRRFLIRVEQINAQSEDEQNWGLLFQEWREAFLVYEPYIANQAKCEKTVVAEFPKLKDAGGSIEMRQMVESAASLYGFLMKPFQRLSKYPLLLEDLHKKGDLDEGRKNDLRAGKEAATSVLESANQAVDREQKLAAVQDLKARVEDWKGHQIDGFGELLIYGSYAVLKSDTLASGKDAERQYLVYLFETILLCCKNLDPVKPKNKLAGRNALASNGKPKLQLKGRIFMMNVTDLVSMMKPGSYTCQIFWKADPGIENFIIKFPTEDAMRKWANLIEIQRQKHKEAEARAQHRESNRSRTSATEFSYLQNQPQQENPYRQQFDDVEDEDEDGDADTLAGSAGGWSLHHYSGTTAYTQNHNGSETSLRSRSTTGESTQAPSTTSSRSAAPRFPPGSLQQQPLALRTRDLSDGTQSPGMSANMDSYFSPTGESPASSIRTSASSGVYPFPVQQVPQNGYYLDGHGHARFTAPAMPRPQPNREPSAPVNGYATSGRGPSSRPSFSNGLHSSQQLTAASRNRSASSPDIHNSQRLAMRSAQPPLPDLPASYQHSVHMINRSQNNSPNVPLGRASPQSSRERMYSNASTVSPTEYPPSSRLTQQSGHQSIRTITPLSGSRAPSQQAFSPPPPPSTVPESNGPAQLRVKVNCGEGEIKLTLVVSTTITYQSLKDRIEAKLQRSTNLSLTDRGPKEGKVRLKYRDEDGDICIMSSDEDVHAAFDAWREMHGHEAQTDAGFGMNGLLGEIELYCKP